MKAEGSSPHSQQSAICPYPELRCTEGSLRFQELCISFVTRLSFYDE
jgi:hypothetical protein